MDGKKTMSATTAAMAATAAVGTTTRVGMDARRRVSAGVVAGRGAEGKISGKQQPQPQQQKQQQTHVAVGSDGDDDNDDGNRQTYSLADMRHRVQSARLKERWAAQQEAALLTMEHHTQDVEREKELMQTQHSLLQERMAAIVVQYERRMMEAAPLDALTISLKKEEEIKEALRAGQETQQTGILKAQVRIEELQTQIAAFHKTETALAQVKAHPPRATMAIKERRRATPDERGHVDEEVERRHKEQQSVLRQQAEQAQRDLEEMRVKLKDLQQEHVTLQDRARHEKPTPSQEDEELRALVTQLEKDKAALKKEAEEGVLLRAKAQSQVDQLQLLTVANEQLRTENQELTDIATDLLDMAEQKQKERKRLLDSADREGDEALARTRKRLRDSLG